MNADMANFIGIHMLNDLIDPHDDVSVINDEEDENQIHNKSTSAQYVDPVTGAHFEYNDFFVTDGSALDVVKPRLQVAYEVLSVNISCRSCVGALDYDRHERYGFIRRKRCNRSGNGGRLRRGKRAE